MNIIFDHGSAFLLAHGGFQIQIEMTKAALEALNVKVEFLRWWDGSQKVDVLHYFGRPVPGYITRAQAKGIKVVIAPLMTGMGSRSRPHLFVQKIATSVARRMLPNMIKAPFGWDSFTTADVCIALTPWEAYLMSSIFGAPTEQVYVVPNGVEDIFLKSLPEKRGPWLVCAATITERKRILELAHAAVSAGTPTWIVGKPYSESDHYSKQFLTLAKQHPNVIRYEGAIDDRQKLARIYRQARGFVLLSTKESLSLSALEAAACECPLLLSDLPWGRTVFKDAAMYCPITSAAHTAKILRQFYNAAPSLKSPQKPLTWKEVAHQLKSIYEGLFKTSR